jgi:hypothetical protein
MTDSSSVSRVRLPTSGRRRYIERDPDEADAAPEPLTAN